MAAIAGCREVHRALHRAHSIPAANPQRALRRGGQLPRGLTRQQVGALWVDVPEADGKTPRQTLAEDDLSGIWWIRWTDQSGR